MAHPRRKTRRSVNKIPVGASEIENEICQSNIYKDAGEDEDEVVDGVSL